MHIFSDSYVVLLEKKLRPYQEQEMEFESE